MSKRNGGGKPGLNGRRKTALKLLEARYEAFKKAGEDKPSHQSTRNGGKKTIIHPARTFAAECERLSGEIKHLKELIL